MIIDETPIHNCRLDYGSQARVLSIIPREIINKASICNRRSNYRLRERALSIIRREIIDDYRLDRPLHL